MTSDTSPSLKIQSLSVGALRPIDLTVAPGEVVCLSGESGSGKSRFLRAVADLEPHEGKVSLGDLDRASMPAHQWREQVMLVPAESQWWADRVGEHFCGPMPEALSALGFSDDVTSWEVARLSSGEKQRLAAIRALSCQPKALLLDEPTANLDDHSIQLFEQWILGVIQTKKMPVLWVAHDEAQMARVGQRHFRIQGDHWELDQ